jgi:GH15 family glucan-1,4-alpha-glucosidase
MKGSTDLGESVTKSDAISRKVSGPNASARSLHRGEKHLRIEDYGLIGDCTTAALVGCNGSIDWLCWPRFDRGACFAALLGSPDHGRWLLSPAEEEFTTSRRYRGETMLLETEFKTGSGSFAVIDFMPLDDVASSVIRIVEGRKGTVRVSMHLTLRFDYGFAVPWVTKLQDGSGISAIAGPDLVALRTPVPLKGEDLATIAEFAVREGERIPFVLTYGRSYRAAPAPIDAEKAFCETEEFWRNWAGRCQYKGARRDAVIRSLLTLKAMTDARTGGIIAAPTTSLPERIGGQRNWDYRYCWIRDATLTLTALMGAGYYDEAKAWRDWLRRSVAGTPSDLQIMYGIAGERRLSEWELPWLPGYEGSKPVRIGNAASQQLQLDVWGEMADALHLARCGGLEPFEAGWDVQLKALGHLEQIWRDPDDGIWEMRGGRRQFTHSKIMAWLAFDRAIKDAERFGIEAPLERWRSVREEIHRTVCEQGYSEKNKSFTQRFGGEELDASLLLIPHVGFLPVEDPRVAGTIAAVERELCVNGFVMRYLSESGADGLPPGEGVFLACSFWLADAWQRQGREDEANAMLDRLLALRNDLGLLSEEYDTELKRPVGNFPQGFSHLSLVQTALGLHGQTPLRDAIAESSKSEAGAV